MSVQATPVAPAADNRPSGVPLAVWSLVQPILFLVPIVVLGSAIGWPSSLALPPDRLLPLINSQPSAVLLGYAAYLLVSIAMIPLAFVLRAFLAARGVSGPAVDAATFIGAAAGVLKTLGIVRWLVAMPALAAQYAGADDTGRRVIEIAYAALNGYAGAVGELLGVQIFTGLWLAAVGVLLIRTGWRWIGGSGAVVGLLFAATAVRLAIPAVAVLQTIAIPLALAWFVVLAVAAARAR